MASIGWQVATVSALRDETERARTISLLLPSWTSHRPGQHVDIRLTAEDGYQAQRSYSIASAPADEPLIDLTVERVREGEVSPFLHDELVVGDRFEVRGPIGGYFVWDAAAADPLLLIAGGSGVVPLMAIVRHRAQVGTGVPCTLLYSSREAADIIYADELERLGARADGLRVIHTLTRRQPPAWSGYARRIDMKMLGEVLEGTGRMVNVFVCGPTALVELTADALVGLGLPASQVRTERFGPSGG
ncbi:MAG TPA: ferredoxin reductase [Candidatus Limnocylindrales bacterium]|nr:ferredoxin reductase [Candidatus Limnocylindrales bacterium]